METLRLTLPCNHGSCFCFEPEGDNARIVYGRLEYQVGYDIEFKLLELTVPSGLDETGVYCAFESVSRKIVRSQGGKKFYVRFRKDGSQTALTFREWLRDIRYRLLGTGTPIVRRIWEWHVDD